MGLNGFTLDVGSFLLFRNKDCLSLSWEIEALSSSTETFDISFESRPIPVSFCVFELGVMKDLLFFIVSNLF